MLVAGEVPPPNLKTRSKILPLRFVSELVSVVEFDYSTLESIGQFKSPLIFEGPPLLLLSSVLPFVQDGRKDLLAYR
jgi:hypothetical protein